MNTITRKQRERLQREQLILDTAQKIINEDGFSNLTMERVAQQIEYSKGTVYNHFSCKEDIISAISCRCLHRLVELFSRAINYDGHTRERISGIIVAHSLYARLHPTELQNMQVIKSKAIRDRISDENQAEILTLEQTVAGMVMNLVCEALDNNDIPAHYRTQVDNIVFGLWTMGYGSNLLHLSGIPFKKLGMRQPLDTVWTNCNHFLDSYQWSPLSSKIDLPELHERLMQELFSEELKQLKRTE